MPSNFASRRRTGPTFPSIKTLRTRSRDEDDLPTQRRQPSPSPPPPPPPPVPDQPQRSCSYRSGALPRRAGQGQRRPAHPTASARGRPQPQPSLAKAASPAAGDSVLSGLSKEDASTLSDRATIMGGAAALSAPLRNIERGHGPNADAYDVLRVSPAATPGEVREAFFCLRYDIYQRLDAGAGAPGSAALTSDERREVEARMDAITGAFHILGDLGRRKAYDAAVANAARPQGSPAVNRSVDTAATDEMGFPVAGNHNATPPPPSPSKLSPPKADGARLPIGQRRSVFRRRAAAAGRRAAAGGGMNPGRRAVAEDVAGDGMNPGRRAVAEDDALDGAGPNWTDFNAGSGGGKGSFAREARDDGQGTEGGPPAREPTRSQGRPATSSSANDSPKAKAAAKDVASPTGVEELDRSHSWSKKGQRGDATKEAAAKSRGTDNGRRGSTTAEETESVASHARSYDDDTRTYDDTRTCDDDSRSYDETTLGDTYADDTTIGESTWASEYDDDTTAYDTKDGAKFSPGHKKGTVPQPILKSGKGNKKGSAKSNGKSVTIHSHRRSASEGDDFALFEGACPQFPGLGAITDEVAGSFEDFTTALHQVGNAFVIGPDDIDRMSDKIRDAKIELGENYQRQVQERRGKKSTAK
ncbi:hypothetical protein ACHAXT_003813 [Thalassiosira profunda]